MLPPWNVKPEWPGVTVRRILPTMDEVEGVTCLEAQRALQGPPRAVPAALALTAVVRPRPLRRRGRTRRGQTLFQADQYLATQPTVRNVVPMAVGEGQLKDSPNSVPREWLIQRGWLAEAGGNRMYPALSPECHQFPARSRKSFLF